MSTVAREPTTTEQEQEFFRQYEALNGRVPGRATETPDGKRHAHLPDPESKIGVVWHVIQTRLHSRFTLEDCTIACWIFNPPMFGLRGYESQHPDTRRVLECFCGRSSLVARGLVKRVGPNRFAVVRPEGERP